ncbi:hypothetical protein KW786_01945 [Candidatus Parcubacteria bacterium]|nr:hypothetical protein [Candidatus Parcubacteria bacterium]
MDDIEILRVCNKLAKPYGLTVEFLAPVGIMAVGVGGDQRTLGRPVVARGRWPGWKALAALSTAICNQTPTNRVTFDITPGPRWLRWILLALLILVGAGMIAVLIFLALA